MPGFKVGVPVELLALEAWLEIQARLMHVQVTIKQVLNLGGDAFVCCYPGEQLAALVNREQRAQCAAVRFAYRSVTGKNAFVAA